MRLGLFGGSFDPVHYGHLLLAEYCLTDCPLDRVCFVPAAVAPHKQGRDISAAEHRVAMLDLAISGHPALEISTLEIDRGGISYTVESLRELKAQDAANELYLLLGADSLHDLPHWKEPAEICALATPVVVRRGGTPLPDYGCLNGIVSSQRLKGFKKHLVDMPAIEISSTEIRRRVAAGRSIRFQTPRAVEAYIEANGLYR